MKPLTLLGLLICTSAVCAWDSIGPFGGSAAVVQADPFHLGTIFAATREASIFRSTNSGLSWTAIPFPARYRSELHAFVIDTRVPWVYFIGVSSEDVRHAGLYRTTDEGRTWTQLPGLARTGVWSIALWPRDPSVIAVGTDTGVFRSTDAGDHWVRLSPEDNHALQPVVSLAFDPDNADVLYAGTPHLPWKTINAGQTWTPIHEGMMEDSDIFSIQVNRKDPSRVLASACSGAYLSNDAGNSWEKLPGAAGGSSRAYQIVSYPGDPNVMFTATSHGLERSNDGGKTWKRLSAYDTRSIAFDPGRKGRMYIATDDAGLFRSDNFGESLRSINRGFSNRRLRSMFGVDGVLYVTSVEQSGRERLLRYTGTQWEQVQSPSDTTIGPVLSIAPLSAKRLVAITPTGWLRSDDVGRTWKSRTLPGGKLTGWIPVTQDGRRVLVGTEKGLYSFDEDDEMWTPARPPAAFEQIDSTFRLSSCLIVVGAGSSWFVTSDAVEFTPITAPCSECRVGHVSSVTAHTLLAASNHGLMRSPNFGRSWSQVAGPMGTSTVSAMCTHPAKNGVAYAAAFGKIFITKDAGTSWTLLTAGPDPSGHIEDMTVIHGPSDKLFVLTHSGGVFRLALEPVE